MDELSRHVNDEPRPSEQEAARDRSGFVYRLRLGVVGLPVLVWRRVDVHGEMSLRSLNRVVRRCFGWRDDRQYALSVRRGWGGRKRSIVFRRVRVCDVAEAGDILTLRYRSGHGQEVDLVVEGLRKAGAQGLPVCLSGKGYCRDAADGPLLPPAARSAWEEEPSSDLTVARREEAGMPIDLDRINANLRRGHYPRLRESEIHKRFRTPRGPRQV